MGNSNKIKSDIARRIRHMYIVEKKRQSKIAEELKVSQATVSRVIKRNKYATNIKMGRPTKLTKEDRVRIRIKIK